MECHLNTNGTALTAKGMPIDCQWSVTQMSLECQWNGKNLPEKLTTTEFLIVKELAQRPGVIKERAHLMDIAYKENIWVIINSIFKLYQEYYKKLNDLEFKVNKLVKINSLDYCIELEDSPNNDSV